MKRLTAGHVSDDKALLDLGKILGQSIAFGTIAGRCSAAQAAAIGQARNDKIHARLRLKWNEFCPQHLKMSGTQADEIIRLFEEFGPVYFEHTHSVRISAATYRLVAPFIADNALHAEGQVLELNSANVQRVAKSVRESQQALLPAPEKPAPGEPAPESLSDSVAALDRSVTKVLAQFREVAKAGREAGNPLLEGSIYRGTFTRLSCELKRVGLESGIV